MAKKRILQEPMILAEVRVDHPQDVLQDITDSFYESADAVARVRDRIARLAEEMASRFAAEEQSGRYEDALCQAPWLTARAQELQQQHVQLIETLNGLRRRCESSDGPVAWWTRIQKDFADFSELLREHEGAEKNLLEEMHPDPEWCLDSLSHKGRFAARRPASAGRTRRPRPAASKRTDSTWPVRNGDPDTPGERGS